MGEVELPPGHGDEARCSRFQDDTVARRSFGEVSEDSATNSNEMKWDLFSSLM